MGYGCDLVVIRGQLLDLLEPVSVAASEFRKMLCRSTVAVGDLIGIIRVVIGDGVLNQLVIGFVCH